MIYKMLYDDEQKEYTSFKLYESLMNESCIKDLVAVLDNLKNLEAIFNLENLDNIMIYEDDIEISDLNIKSIICSMIILM